MATQKSLFPGEESGGEIILYRTEDGRTEIELHADGYEVWLDQGGIAELFETSRANVTLHIRNIYVEGELMPGNSRKPYLLERGRRKLRKGTQLYSLPMILAIGFRVRSPRGVQFRQWAARNLSEYLVKGFVMNDAALKNPGGRDYFDELLARIRDIRASEKRFYQKVRDLFALSDDYEPRKHEQEVKYFFANVQNMLLFAITGRTAAELITDRADPSKPNMNLTAWEGGRVRQTDIFTAKNYLTADEIDSLNRLVAMFLDRAEFAAKRRQQLTLAYWRESTAELLRSNGLPILDGFGSVSHEDMKHVVARQYEEFDENRKAAEAREADARDIAELEEMARMLPEPGKTDPGA